MARRDTVRRNAIARALATGKPATGFHMSIPVPQQIELLRGLGFEFVFLDAEHGVFTIREIEDCCRAAELYDLTIVARVPGPDANVISQFLNAGVQGIVVPHVETVAEARVAIESCRYAPAGLRPSGGSRASGYWRDVTDIAAALRDANDNVTLAVQIESMAGVSNLPAILDLGGIDYFTIGKQDLAQSMGFPRLADGWPAEVLDATARCIDLIRARGGRMKDDVMTVVRVNKLLVDGARGFLIKQRDAADVDA